jgi:hypothetical protein
MLTTLLFSIGTFTLLYIGFVVTRYGLARAQVARNWEGADA